MEKQRVLCVSCYRYPLGKIRHFKEEEEEDDDDDDDDDDDGTR